MSWAMIKKALNSSLGRQDFMPLNEQINSLKALYASDDVYHTHPITGIIFQLHAEQSAVIPYNIKMICDGTAYFRVEYDVEKSKYFSATLNIYKNTDFLTSYSFASTFEKSPLVSYRNGDVFSFDIEYQGSENASLLIPTGLSILGTIQENNVIKIL